MKFNCETCHPLKKGFFCHFDSQLLSEILREKTIHKYKKGQHIFREGAPAIGAYCIRSGKIKVTKKLLQGKESIIRIASSGELLGHYWLFTGDLYHTSAIALEDTQVCFLEKKFFIQLVQANPNLSMTLLKKLSEEMSKGVINFTSIIQRNVRERLADLLLNLSAAYGEPEDGRIRLPVKLTRDEMASMIGTVNETVIRLMSEFKDEGLIEEEKKVIYIVNKEKLSKFASR